MLNTIDLRLAHYPSRNPILIELKAQRDATVRQLRAQISEVMQADEHCLMRVFGRLFVEVQAGEVKRLSAIEPSDEGESLLRLGIEDGDVLYLEGPVTDNVAGVGMAIAMVNEKMEQRSAEVAAHIKQLQEESKASRQMIEKLTDNMDALRADLSRQCVQAAADLQALRGEVDKQQSFAETLKADLAEQVKQQSAEHTKQLKDENMVQRQMIQRQSDEIRALAEQNQRTEANLKTYVANQQALAVQEQQRLTEIAVAEKVKQQWVEHALQTKQLQEKSDASRRMINQLTDTMDAFRADLSLQVSAEVDKQQQRLSEKCKADFNEKMKQQLAGVAAQIKQLQEESTATRQLVQRHMANQQVLAVQEQQLSDNVERMRRQSTKESEASCQLVQQNQRTEANLKPHAANQQALAVQEQQAQQFMAKIQNVKGTDSDGWTPLQRAAKAGNVAAMEYLLSKGADVKAADNYGDTPLHEAAFAGHVAAMDFLLSKGADAKGADNYGSTPLHEAAFGGHVAAMELLLSKGANAKTADKDGYTPLHYAAQGGHFAAMELLLSKSADVNAATKNGLTALQLYKGKDPRIIVLLTP